MGGNLGKTEAMPTTYLKSHSRHTSTHRTRRRVRSVYVSAGLVVLTIGLLLPAAVPAVATPSGKTWDGFIHAVWAFESSIDPSQQAFYEANWNNPVMDPYPLVEFPGRVIRNPATGDPEMSEKLTVEQYFEAIGVADLFDHGTATISWEYIQSQVTNYLGFVGFQFQESDLYDLGYYKYATVAYQGKIYPSHYVDVPNSNWTNGRTGFLDTNPSQVSEPTWVTDVIHWDAGQFTGKYGVSSYNDFINPTKHKLIIQDHFVNKFYGIVSELAKHDKRLNDYLGTTITWNGLNPSVSPPPGNRANSVIITLSGLLAGAHLRGAEGVIELLVNHQNPADESGTYILQYVQDYAGYDTPFHPNISCSLIWEDDNIPSYTNILDHVDLSKNQALPVDVFKVSACDTLK